MKIACFTSFSFSYLDRARVLFASIRKYHPDWTIFALIVDRPPSSFYFDPSSEDIDFVVYADELGIPDFNSWIFSHNVIEACTAVKGPFIRQLCDRDFDAAIYLDPDTCLFATMSTVISALSSSAIILTPHQLRPDDNERAIIDNEITSLKTGIYNLGFLAIRTRGEGKRFASWWRDRLLAFCHDRIDMGLFVDQRWCDHVPSFFDDVRILKDPGCNVASWNLSTRKISIDEAGRVLVNNVPLRFWHFTKAGPLGDIMTRRYAQRNFQVYELWNWYNKQLADAREPSIPMGYWAFGAFADGTPIRSEHRLTYRSRADLKIAFPDPWASGPNSYQEWFSREAGSNI